MHKEELLAKVRIGGTRDEIIKWVKGLPNPPRKPLHIKIGDVFMHPYFRHPVVVLRIRKNRCICGSLSNSGERSTLMPTDSRFFNGQFITTNIAILHHDELLNYGFMGIYDNHMQLRHVFNELVNIVR